MSTMRTVKVDGEARYDICIGPNLLGDSALLSHALRGRHALIVSDGNVAPLYADEGLLAHADPADDESVATRVTTRSGRLTGRGTLRPA